MSPIPRPPFFLFFFLVQDLLDGVDASLMDPVGDPNAQYEVPVLLALQKPVTADPSGAASPGSYRATDPDQLYEYGPLEAARVAAGYPKSGGHSSDYVNASMDYINAAVSHTHTTLPSHT